MQIPLISIPNHLHNHNSSFLSHIQFIAVTSFQWSTALVLTLLTNVRIIITFQRNTPSIPLLIINNDDDYDFTDADEDSDRDTSEDDEEDGISEDIRRKGEYVRFGGETGAGSFLRRRSVGDLFSLSEINNIRLGFAFDDSEEESVVSIYKQEQRIHSVRKTTAMAISNTSPAVVVSAGENGSGVRIWDKRLRQRNSAVIAEWAPAVAVELNAAEYSRFTLDDCRYGLTVGDISHVRLPSKFNGI